MSGERFRLCRRGGDAAIAKQSWKSPIATAALVTAVLAASVAAAQQKDQAAGDKDTLAQNFLAEHEIGRRYQIDPNNLPAPKSGPIVTDRALTVPYNGQALQLPTGFTATLFASGLANPRRLLVLPNG